MRKIMCSTLILLSLVSMAQAAVPEVQIDTICVTEFPTTSFFVAQEGKNVHVRVIHHNGTKYMPIWNSIVTPNDVAQVQQAAQVLTKLGDQLEFDWDAQGCHAEGHDYFECVGQGKDFVVNGVKVHPWALSATKVSETTMFGNFQKTKISLRLEIEKTNYLISMDYSPKECVSSTEITKK